MANTPVIDLEDEDTVTHPPHYTTRVEEDRIVNANADKLDSWAGHCSASFATTLCMSSGSASDNMDDGAIIGAAYSPTDRVIKEVICWAHKSGSGGVSRIDVDIQQGVAGNFSSIFSNSAFKPALSSSLGNFGIARSSTFVSGSNTVWPAGTIIRANLETAAGAAGLSGQKGVTVEIRWTPSGTFGAGV